MMTLAIGKLIATRICTSGSNAVANISNDFSAIMPVGSAIVLTVIADGTQKSLQ
ncbi:hypothetical protein BFZC1_07003 [Lysinibacillus fusiformis ZC1]|nr:hypothetical protein BFZC1_07003 [Lysinibacillus fusiformis ZC1]